MAIIQQILIYLIYKSKNRINYFINILFLLISLNIYKNSQSKLIYVMNVVKPYYTIYSDPEPVDDILLSDLD